MTKITGLIIFAIVSIVEMPQVAIGSDSKSVSKHDEEILRSQIKQFLSTWLVDRDFAKAIDSFSARAFSNKAIFDESCSGIQDEARNSAEAMKNEIGKFLNLDEEDFPVSDDLNVALSANSLLPFKRLKSKSVSNMEQDRFLLLRIKASDVADFASESHAHKFLKEYFKSTQPLYLSIISIGDAGGIVYFIWEKDGENWKISHASLVCM